MKTLNTLVKIHQQKLDAIRRNLVSLESQRAQLLALSKNLEKELAKEIGLAEQNSELAGFFGDYITRIRERQERVTREVAELDGQVDTVRAAIRLEYSEQLKYEQILEAKLKEKRAAEERKEAIELDEIASDQHQRKEEVES